jgi:hypothetical protein
VIDEDHGDDLQDYLDGRLPESERARFEARLARDPELTRRVQAYRRIGDVLREAPAELPPGFLGRARARFEARYGRRRRFRPLSWEAAGLVAAALVVAFLFIPPWFRERFEEEPLETPVFGQSPGRAAAPPEPAAQQVREPARERKDAVEDEARGAEEPANNLAAPITTGAVADAVEKSEPPPDRALAARAAASSVGRSRRAVAVALPPGLLGPNEIRLAGDRSELRSIGVEADLATDRVLLIGPRSRPIDCDRIEFAIPDQGPWVVTVFPGIGESGSSTGCAAILPAGDAQVVVVDAGDHRHE